MPTFRVESFEELEVTYVKWNKALLPHSYRRPIMNFNQMGMFSSEKITHLPGKGQSHWEISTDGDPMEETCFVTRQALSNLLQASSGIYAIFLSPDSEYSSRLSPVCHGSKDLTDGCNNLSVETLLHSASVERHNYWKLRLRCKTSHELNEEI
jgi:hypothetical protein